MKNKKIFLLLLLLTLIFTSCSKEKVVYEQKSKQTDSFLDKVEKSEKDTDQDKAILEKDISKEDIDLNKAALKKVSMDTVLREKPVFLDDNVITVIPKSSNIKVVEFEIIGNDIWAVVAYKGQIGYINYNSIEDIE